MKNFNHIQSCTSAKQPLIQTLVVMLFFTSAPIGAAAQSKEAGPSSQPTSSAQQQTTTDALQSEKEDSEDSEDLGETQEISEDKQDESTAQTENIEPSPTGSFAPASLKKRVFRGSSTTVRNSFSVLSLTPDAEITYNPIYFVNLSLDPLVWAGDMFFVAGHVDVTRDLTENDWTTYANESYLSDTFIIAGARNFYTLPYLKLNFSANTVARLPTSKLSWARTMLTGVSARGEVARSFSPGWIAGVNLRYAFSGTQFFYRYTTGERESSLEDDRCVNLQYCSIYASDGVRNVERSIANQFTGLIAIWSWLAIHVRGQLITQWLYPMTIDERVSFHPENPDQLLEEQNKRFLTIFDTGLSVTPTPAFTIRVGASTIHPQLKPNGKYRIPGFNRFTNLYIDLICNWDGLAASLLD